MNPPENWRPASSTDNLRARATLLRDIRDFFSEREVMEVETPLLSAAGNTDPEIGSITTDCGHYLRTSPEFPLKRMLAAGSGDIFELGRVFRANESGRSHNPEFTMLEWYRAGISYHHLMDEVGQLVKHCGHGKFDQWPVEKLRYADLFLRYLQLDPFTADTQALRAVAMQHGAGEMDLERRQWLDYLVSLVIQPTLPKRQLTFVFDFPAEQAALARIRHHSTPVAERFELYLGRTELANGYQELTDAVEQQQRFLAENDHRTKRGQKTCPIDEHLVAALENGLPDCAGVALGVDRLLMAVVGAESINDVIAFPSSRA